MRSPLTALFVYNLAVFLTRANAAAEMPVLTTNLYSFVSFGKTQKLHGAIDHWLAGVTRQAHLALDGVTKEDTAVQRGHDDDGVNKEVNKSIHEDTGGGGEGGGCWWRTGWSG